MLVEVRNIENCLNYFIEIGKQHAHVKYSRITQNKSKENLLGIKVTGNTFSDANSPENDNKKQTVKPILRQGSGISFNSDANMQRALA